MNLFHDLAVSSFTLADLRQFVTDAEKTIGPLVGIFPLRDSSKTDTSLFYFDTEAGHVQDANLTTLDVIATGVPPAVAGKQLVCVSRAFVEGNLVQLAAYRPNGTPSRLDLSTLPLQHVDMAELIATIFSEEYDVIHQAAALASATAESSLNPTAHSKPPEDSVGLFQFNRAPRAAGADKSTQDLENPEFNTRLALQNMKAIPGFKAATTLDAAVDVFVRKFEQPANQDAAVALRQEIASRILRS